MSVFLVSMVGLVIFSCEGPDCHGIDCGANGTGDERTDCKTCTCSDGYETDSLGKCTILGVTKFIGTWQKVQECDSIGTPYNMVISKDSTNVKNIKITNFVNMQCNGNQLVVTATLQRESTVFYNTAKYFASACTSITINQANNFMRLEGDTLKVAYNIEQNGQTKACFAKLVKL